VGVALDSGPIENQNPETTMKKFLVLAGLATCAGAFGTAAQAQASGSSVTIYGLLDSGVDIPRAGRPRPTRVFSGGAFGSRLGFRGTEDLGGGLSAVFRLEQGVNVDTGTFAQGGSGFGRESSVGLASPAWGLVQLGRLPTPYYSVQSQVDAFSWIGSGGLTAISRSGATSQQVLPQAVGARYDNAVQYISPRWSGVEARAIYSWGEDSPVLGHAIGGSVRYTAGPLDVVGGYGSQKGAGAGQVRSQVVGGSYDFGVARVYAGWTRETNSCTTCTGTLVRPTGVPAGNASDFRLVNLGAKIPSGAWTTMVQVVRVMDHGNYAVNPGNRDATWFAIGGEYGISKRTFLYTTLGTIDNRNGSQYALGSGTAQQPAGFVPAGDPRVTTLTLGIRHVF
jgi:predicted porin